jgi:hypothetical protein
MVDPVALKLITTEERHRAKVFFKAESTETEGTTPVIALGSSPGEDTFCTSVTNERTTERR